MNPEEIKVGETYNVRMKLHLIDEDGDFCFHVSGGDDIFRCLKPTQVERAVFPLSAPADVTKNTETAPENLNILEEQPKMIKLITNGFTQSEASHAGASAQEGKYDPNRPFREGDIVTPCSVKGRWLDSTYKERVGILFTVTKDEDEDGIIWVKDPDRIHQDCGDCVYFQLVTPVEELEPYFVQENHSIVEVLSIEDQEVPATVFFKSKHKNARERAEAECERLNAEHRKEQA